MAKISRRMVMKILRGEIKYGELKAYSNKTKAAQTIKLYHAPDAKLKAARTMDVIEENGWTGIKVYAYQDGCCGCPGEHYSIILEFPHALYE